MRWTTMTALQRTKRLTVAAAHKLAPGVGLHRPESPDLPSVPVGRSRLELTGFTIAFALLGIYGDSLVAGALGQSIAIVGLLGVAVLLYTIVAGIFGPSPTATHAEPHPEQ